jgi:HK97 family phage portal protein
MSWLRDFGAPTVNVSGETVPSGWSFDNASWVTSFQKMPAAGVPVDYDNAITCATVYACSDAIAGTLASMPAIVYESAKDDSHHPAKNSRFWSLLHDQPNRDMDSMQFFELVTTRALNRGNGYAWIERNSRDEPIALWPIHNSRVIPWWSLQDSRLEYHVYLDKRAPDSPWGWGYYVVPQRDMFNLVGFNSLNGIIAPGVIPCAREDISLDKAAQRYGASWFGNGARPSGVVKYPGAPMKNKQDMENFRRDVNGIHGGMENWNKVGVLWNGAEYQEIGVAPEQAQFLATRTLTAKVICRYYKCPPAVVQIFDDYKFATVDAMLSHFVKLCLRNWAVRWERAIQRQIFHTRNGNDEAIPLYPNREWLFEFLMDDLLRGDRKSVV